MKLSVLSCWGPGREAFWEWFCWNLTKQEGLDFGDVELVVDAPPSAAEFMSGLDLPVGLVRLVSSENTPVPVKRNRLMDAAQGSYFCWMDSDDWQSPTRLAHGLRVLEETDALFVAFAGLRYLRMPARLWCELPHYRRRPVPITTMAVTSLARTVRFDESRERGTDTIWHRMLDEKFYDRGVVVHRPQPFFFALEHGGNMTPQIKQFRYTEPVSALARLCGDEWVDTSEMLTELDGRLDAMRGGG